MLLLSAPHTRSLRTAGLDRITLSLDGTTGASVARMAGLADAAAGERALAAVLAALIPPAAPTTIRCSP